MLKISNYKSQIRAIVYDWTIKAPNDDETWANLTKSNRLYISKHITAATFTKNMNSPSGTFEIILDNSRDWTRVIQRDTWCTLYFSNNEVLPIEGIPDPKFSRGMCYIERVSERIIEEEEGAREITYSITGRDFGKVYEDTEIWQNYFKFEKTIAQTLTANLKLDNIATTDKLMDLGHKLFFSSLSDLPGNATISEIAQQWLLPEAMLKDLGLSLRKKTNGAFFGHIDGLLNLSETNTTIPLANPLASINGKAWNKLKEWSVEPLNELFTELNEKGVPQLIYRPIPWGINKENYPSLSKNIMSFRKLAQTSVVEVEPHEISFVDIGKDSHNRYNHFFAWSAASRHSQFDNVSELKSKSTKGGREFPYVKKASVLRHGFRPMHVELNTITYSVKDPKNGRVNTKLLLEYNEVMYDYWAPAAYFGTGAVTLVGRNDVKVGKAIYFKEGSRDNLAGKVFYIEGYTDEYVVEPDGKESWYQTLQLTRGVELTKLKENFSETELEEDTDPIKEGYFIED